MGSSGDGLGWVGPHAAANVSGAGELPSLEELEQEMGDFPLPGAQQSDLMYGQQRQEPDDQRLLQLQLEGGQQHSERPKISEHAGRDYMQVIERFEREEDAEEICESDSSAKHVRKSQGPRDGSSIVRQCDEQG